MGESYVRYILDTATSAAPNMVVAELPAGIRFPESRIITTRPTHMWIGSAEATESYCSHVIASFFSLLPATPTTEPAAITDQATRLTRLLKTLLNWDKARVQSVLCYMCTSRFSGSQRRTMERSEIQTEPLTPELFEVSDFGAIRPLLSHTPDRVRQVGRVSPSGATGTSHTFALESDQNSAECTEGLNDSLTVAAIRKLPIWSVAPNHRFSMVRVGGNAVHSGLPNRLTETREFFGFIDWAEPEHSRLASVGVFPVQYGRLRRDHAARSYVLDEPYLTFAMFSDEPDVDNVQARAYTIHVDPSSSRVSAVLSYITNAKQRLAITPDLRFGLDHHRAKGECYP